MEINEFSSQKFIKEMIESNPVANLELMTERIASSLIKKKIQDISVIRKDSVDKSGKAKEKITELKKLIKDFENEATKYLDFSPIQKSAIDSMTDEIKQIVIETDEKGPKVTEIGEHVRIIENRNLENLDKLSTRQSNVNENLQNIQQHLTLFEEFFGLKVERSSSSHLRFTLSCIDESNTCCYFSLKLDNDVYDVFDVIPEIDNLDTLITELNKDNDLRVLRTFFCKIRKSFKMKSKSIADDGAV